MKPKVCLVAFGGERFYPIDIFSSDGELHFITGKSLDVFEIREIKVDSPLYNNIVHDGIYIRNTKFFSKNSKTVLKTPKKWAIYMGG